MSYTSLTSFGQIVGRGELEAQVLSTLRTWLIWYVARIERGRGLPPRSTPVNAAVESIHGDIDLTRFETAYLPEVIVVVVPTGTVEREDDGAYGQWFDLTVAAVVSVPGEQDATRALADVYGTALEGLLVQQGGFGVGPSGDPFATRTRLLSAPRVEFPNDAVRDIVRTVVTLRSFVSGLVSDLDGPRTPPTGDPYATDATLPVVNRVEIDLVDGTPGDSGPLSADAAIIDATVIPETITYKRVAVNVPPRTN